MQTRNLVHFLGERAKSDSPFAFGCRMLRFATIAGHISWWTEKKRLASLNGRYGGYVIRNIMGSKMRLDLTDTGVSHDLIINGIREPYITEAFRKEVTKGNTIIDIGANIGYYALQEAQLVGEWGRVYAIEPVVESMEMLKRNIKLNEYKNIKTYDMAIGNYTGKVSMNIHPLRNLSSISGISSRTGDSRMVDITTLDKFIENNVYPDIPDLIRMDVEGYESEIIKGMANLLNSQLPLKLLVEIHFNILREKSIPMLKRLKEARFKIRVASIEPHPAVLASVVGRPLTALLEMGMGACSGYQNITIDDLINDKRFSSGQVEWLEVLFVRE